MHNVLCVDRCAVPATLLSNVLGLPKDWLSRLPGSIQWYVSVWVEQPQGGATVRVIAGPYGIFFGSCPNAVFVFVYFTL